MIWAPDAAVSVSVQPPPTVVLVGRLKSSNKTCAPALWDMPKASSEPSPAACQKARVRNRTPAGMAQGCFNLIFGTAAKVVRSIGSKAKGSSSLIKVFGLVQQYEIT